MPSHHAQKYLNEMAIIAAFDHEYPPAAQRLHKQIGRFYVYGAFNTLVDFATLNLCLYAFHLPIVIANSLAISMALLSGYIINRWLVFRGSRPGGKRHVGYYIAINLLSLYGLQNGIFLLMEHYPIVQTSAASFTASLITLPLAALQTNFTKLISGFLSGVWNFILFRKFVFTY